MIILVLNFADEEKEEKSEESTIEILLYKS